MDRSFDLSFFFECQRKEAQRLRFASKPVDPRKIFARQVERSVMYRLAERGHHVLQQKRNARFDILVDDCLRVEVKAAKWHASPSGGRYQACIHNLCDLVIFVCVNGSHHHFVIPAHQLGTRKNIAVWSHNPKDYAGQWAKYFEAWRVVDNAVQVAQRRPHQLSFGSLVTESRRPGVESVTNSERR